MKKKSQKVVSRFWNQIKAFAPQPVSIRTNNAISVAVKKSNISIYSTDVLQNSSMEMYFIQKCPHNEMHYNPTLR